MWKRGTHCVRCGLSFSAFSSLQTTSLVNNVLSVTTRTLINQNFASCARGLVVLGAETVAGW